MAEVFVKTGNPTPCWMRRIRIELTSQKYNEKLIFGDNEDDNLTIKINGTKYNAPNKDCGVVTINNLSYETMIKLIEGEYYKIKISAGYKNNISTIFTGGVAFISHKIHSTHDTECYIAYNSDLVASFSQWRMQFSLNSSINLYSALYAVSANAGFGNIHLDSSLKEKFLNEAKTYYSDAATILDAVAYQTDKFGSFTWSTDNSDGNIIDVTTTTGKRYINIDSTTIPIGGGNPTVTSEGLKISLLPVFNFKVGDIIIVENRLIDVSVNTPNVYSGNTFNTNYLDSKGQYMILELNYNFENRGSNFIYNIKARSVENVIKRLLNQE